MAPGKRAGVRNRLRARAHRTPLPSILLANVQSLENKFDDLRARVDKCQRYIRDCNLLCFTETWLNPAVPDHAIQPAEFFSHSSDDINVFTEAVVGFIGKLADDTVQKTIIRTFPNQKPWVDKTIHDALRSLTAHTEKAFIISEHDMRRAFSRVNTRKAAGPDGISG
ncbi:hypothetical protein QTP70_030713 [Hemibagrus guttatus]|uniref:Uncharacterized protein n=1 Tax=Hemibagrus guttatus TaxID=175788 RepID=A0AAE0QPA4_9TELE|nr:hypothetical protein QTP70_030713 [Hemibagrus guttatus]